MIVVRGNILPPISSVAMSFVTALSLYFSQYVGFNGVCCCRYYSCHLLPYHRLAFFSTVEGQYFIHISRLISICSLGVNKCTWFENKSSCISDLKISFGPTGDIRQALLLALLLLELMILSSKPTLMLIDSSAPFVPFVRLKGCDRLDVLLLYLPSSLFSKPSGMKYSDTQD